MPSRELRTAKEIGAWITAELQKVEDCEECKVNAVMRLREPDSE